ncbi:MAG: polyprenyl synthetase family protein [Christensenellaceae bacterium]|nr:polyprenyl synthetase family protein [Christensenellaceae bacterium]
MLKYEEYKTLVENYIDSLKQNNEIPSLLLEAMLYSLSQKGKRLRAVLLLASYNLLNEDVENVVPYAVAIEMIHTYSLIHDDLPAMDNDTLRRGQPTNHIKYGEDVAILAGDGLLNYAFEIALEAAIKSLDSVNPLKAIKAIANAAGVTGMIAGQITDIKASSKDENKVTKISYIHEKKTASLIIGAISAGLILAKATEEQIKAGEIFGYNLGISFQIIDDILDIVGKEEELGKSIGKDIDDNKLTYTSIYGIEKSREQAKLLTNRACEEIKSHFPKSDFFVELANSMLDRVK